MPGRRRWSQAGVAEPPTRRVLSVLNTVDGTSPTKSPTKQTRTENGNDVSGLFAESEDEYIDASDGTPEPGEEYESEWAEVIPQAQLDFSEPELLEVATTTVTLGNFQAVTPLDFGTVEHETTTVASIIVTNPSLVSRTLKVLSFPKDKGFTIEWAEAHNPDEDPEGQGSAFEVESTASVTLTIKWAPGTPPKTTSVRHIVTLGDGRHRFQVKLVGRVHVPTPKKTYKATRVPQSNRVGYKPVFKVSSRRLSAERSSPVPTRKVLTRRSKSVKIIHRPREEEPQPKPAASEILERRAKAMKRSLKLRKRPTGEASNTAPVRTKTTSRSTFCDADWVQKQERMFQKWLNFEIAEPQASPREAITNREKIVSIAKSEAVLQLMAKIDREIEAGRLALRDDRSLREDVGLQGRFLDTILGYSTKWLSAGLYAVLNMHIDSDDGAIRAVLCSHLLSSPEIETTFAHPTMPGAHKGGYELAVRKHCLSTFLRLVLVLDHAKNSGIRAMPKCLFRRNKDVPKSSADVLRGLNPVLKGEGDFLKHLSKVGYIVVIEQSPLDEVNYLVSNLSQDLRNGVILSRVVEVLSGGRCDVLSALRYPAETTDRKIHNVAASLSTLMSLGCNPRIMPKDIVDGHRERTLTLLWNMMMFFQIGSTVDIDRVRAEVTKLRLRDPKSKNDKRRLSGEQLYQNSERLSAMLNWAHEVCQGYGVSIHNFTSSFSDGTAFLLLIHHYMPSVVPFNKIKITTTHSADRSVSERAINADGNSHGWKGSFSPGINRAGGRSREKLLQNEKSNFTTLNAAMKQLGGIPLMAISTDMSDTIPDEKVVIACVAYICARLLELSDETRAATRIQAAYRQWKRGQNIQVGLRSLLEKEAARKEEAARQEQLAFIRRTVAVIKIQAWVRRYLVTQHNVLRSKAIIIQRAWRQYSQNRLRHSQATHIQTAIRCFLARRELTSRKFHRDSTAAVRIQRCYRAFRCRTQVSSAIRGRQEALAATKIQTRYRAFRATKHVQFLRRMRLEDSAALRIQRCYLAFRFRSQVHMTSQRRRERAAAICIQSTYRGFVTRKDLVKQKQAAVVIQRAYGRYILRTYLFQLQATQERTLAALTIQTIFRKTRAERDRVCLARNFLRAQQLVKEELAEREWEDTQEAAAVKIQSAFRMYKARREVNMLRNENENAAAIRIQKCCRCYLARKHFGMALESRRRVTSAMKIQAAYRGYLNRTRFMAMRLAAKVIQSAYRGHCVRATLNQQAQNAIRIQSAFRGYRARSLLRHQQHAARVIQRAYAQYVLRSHLALLQTSQERTIAALMLQKAFRIKQARRDRVVLLHNHARIQQLVREANEEIVALERTAAATKIQRAFRRHVERMHRDTVEQNAAVRIQKAYRIFRSAQLLAKFRAVAMECLAVSKQAAVAAQQEQAAATIQSFWRCATQRARFLQHKHAAMILQSNYRRVLAIRQLHTLRQARADELERARIVAHFAKNAARCLAAITIQRRYRQYRCELANSAARTDAAIIIQSYVRGYLVRRNIARQHRAAIVIAVATRQWLAWRASTRLDRAATKIQAMYRGHVTRKKLGKRAREIRRRALEANARFNPKMTLAARTSSALEILLTHKQLSYVLRACENLDVATKLSSRCCVRLVEERAVPVIFQLIRNCNRSAPHIAVMTRALHIIAHLAACQKTVAAVATQKGTFEMLVELIQMYRDKEDILSVTVDILGALAKDEDRVEKMKKEKGAVDRLKAVLDLIERKAKLATKLRRGNMSANGVAVSAAQLKLLHARLSA